MVFQKLDHSTVWIYIFAIILLHQLTDMYRQNFNYLPQNQNNSKCLQWSILHDNDSISTTYQNIAITYKYFQIRHS